jgi:hypothetical protein
MRAAVFSSVLCLSALACTTIETPIDGTLPADGLAKIQLQADTGDLAYQGDREDQISIQGRAWGQASDEQVAQERLDAVRWTAFRDGDAAVVEGQSASGMAGTDLYVRGPAQVDVRMFTESGDAELGNVRGTHVVIADSIEGVGISGSVDLRATSGGVDVALAPNPGDTLRIESDGGPVIIEVPWGLDYDVQVWGDAEYQVRIEDLGFDHVIQNGAYFAGIRGQGRTRLDVVVQGGDVEIRAGRDWTSGW